MSEYPYLYLGGYGDAEKFREAMRRMIVLFAAAFALAAAFSFPIRADTPVPADMVQSRDGKELRKIYVLPPEDDPACIPTDDFEQDGFHYSFSELLRQEQEETEEREHSETLTANNARNDTASVLALLPQEREVETEDGFSGILPLDLDSVHTEAAEYGTQNRTVTASRSYSGFYIKDENSIPRTVTEEGQSLTLQSVSWTVDSMGIYTASATYSGTVTSRYVKSYTVSARYTGTVSRTIVKSVRYEAVFSGAPIPIETPEPTPAPTMTPIPTPTPTPTQEPPPTPEPQEAPLPRFNWLYVWIPLGVLALGGGAIAVGLIVKRRAEYEEDDDDEEE